MSELTGWQRAGVIAAQVLTVCLLGFAWQAAANAHAINTFFFSSPRIVWHQLDQWASGGELFPNVGATLYVLAIGYLLGLALGIVLGVVSGVMRTVGAVIDPFVAFFNAIPRLVLLPLLIVWFGFGYWPQIFFVVAVVVFLVAINVSAGLRQVKTILLANARVLGANGPQLVRYVYLPSIVVWIMSTARVTVGFAFQAAVAAEFIGAARGLGFLVEYGQSTFQVQQIYAALAIMIVIAVVVDLGLGAVERSTTKWLPK
jgi:NitT/TauT family transport system permease protein